MTPLLVTPFRCHPEERSDKGSAFRSSSARAASTSARAASTGCPTFAIPRSAARFLRARFLRATRNPSGKQKGEAIRPSASQDDEAALWVAASAATFGSPRQIVFSRRLLA
jgi:hypothetical protein